MTDFHQMNNTQLEDMLNNSKDMLKTLNTQIKLLEGMVDPQFQNSMKTSNSCPDLVTCDSTLSDNSGLNASADVFIPKQSSTQPTPTLNLSENPFGTPLSPPKLKRYNTDDGDPANHTISLEPPTLTRSNSHQPRSNNKKQNTLHTYYRPLQDTTSIAKSEPPLRRSTRQRRPPTRMPGILTGQELESKVNPSSKSNIEFDVEEKVSSTFVICEELKRFINDLNNNKTVWVLDIWYKGGTSSIRSSWRESTVVGFSGHRVLIHYNGWTCEHDVWLDLTNVNDSRRIAREEVLYAGQKTPFLKNSRYGRKSGGIYSYIYYLDNQQMSINYYKQS